MRARTNKYCLQYHQKWIFMWNDRHNYIIERNKLYKNDHLYDTIIY